MVSVLEETGSIRKQNRTEELLFKIKTGTDMSFSQQLKLVLYLSIPAVMAQITSIIMQYIDASMVGRLGAAKSASIGLVSSSTWLFGGLCTAAVAGFTVQVAQLIGAGKEKEARAVLRQALLVTIFFSILLVMIGTVVSFPLPGWLGGGRRGTRRCSPLFPYLYLLASGNPVESAGGRDAAVQREYAYSQFTKYPDVRYGRGV